MNTSPNPSAFPSSVSSTSSVSNSSNAQSKFVAAQLTVIEDDRVRMAQEEARGLGYAAGYSAGARVAAKENEELRAVLAEQAARQFEQNALQVNAAATAFAAAARASHERVLPVIDDVRELVYRLALELAESVVQVDMYAPVGAEFDGAPRGALAALRRALTVPSDTSVVRVRMNPADLRIIQEYWEAVEHTAAESGLDINSVELVADQSMAVGDAISEFEDGFLDARVRSAFERARESLDTELAALTLATQKHAPMHSVNDTEHGQVSA